MRRPLTTTASLALVASLAATAFACEGRDDAEPAPARGPAGQLAQILAEPDAIARTGELAGYLRELGPEGLPAVRELLGRNRVSQNAGEFELLLRFWAGLEPEAAVDWAFAQRRSRHRVLAVATSIELLARIDPDAAIARIEAAEQDDDALPLAQISLARGWFHRDREASAAYIASLEPGSTRTRSLMGYALELGASEGSDAVMEWAEQLAPEDDALRFAAYYQVSSALAWIDPPAAKRWCDEHCEGPYGHGIRAETAAILLRRGEEGGSVLAWVGRAPESRTNDLALVEAYRFWLKRSRLGALGWLAQKKATDPEPWLRKLYGAYARELSAKAPGEAARFLVGVEAESEAEAAAREELLVEIVEYWLHVDRERALAWLEEAPLSDEARRRALAAVPSPEAADASPQDAASAEL